MGRKGRSIMDCLPVEPGPRGGQARWEPGRKGGGGGVYLATMGVSATVMGARTGIIALLHTYAAAIVGPEAAEAQRRRHEGFRVPCAGAGRCVLYCRRWASTAFSRRTSGGRHRTS